MLVHLVELRRRLLMVLFFFVALFLLFFFFDHDLFYGLMRPLLRALPQHNQLIATQLISPLLTPLKLAMDAALFFTVPFALFHLWHFMSPGLYRAEQKKLTKIIFMSLILFFMGALFCYFLVLPMLFQLFAQTVPTEVQFMPDMANALEFITQMLLLFGLCFQVPLISVVLVQFNLVSVKTLIKVRPYVIVGAFVVGMLLTPPDVLSQIMLAIPLCLLYELGIIFCRIRSHPERSEGPP